MARRTKGWYPTCQLLDGLEYATIRDGTSRGNYVKLIELTGAGRQALAADLEDRVVVTFNWRWAQLNALGNHARRVGLSMRGSCVTRIGLR